MTDTASDNRKPGWFYLDNEIIDDLDLLPHTGWLYCTIVRHMNRTHNDAFPSLETLAKKSNMSKPTVIKHLSILETLGLIIVTRIKTDDGENKVNHYHLTNVEGVVKDFNQGSKGGLPGVVKEVYSNKTQVNKTPSFAGARTEGQPESNQTDSCACGDVGENSDPEEFVEVIPKQEQELECQFCKTSLVHTLYTDGNWHCSKCDSMVADVSLVTTPSTENLVWQKVATTGAVTKRGGIDEKNINFDKAVDMLVRRGMLECKKKNRIPLRHTLTEAGQQQLENHHSQFIPSPMSPVPPMCKQPNGKPDKRFHHPGSRAIAEAIVTAFGGDVAKIDTALGKISKLVKDAIVVANQLAQGGGAVSEIPKIYQYVKRLKRERNWTNPFTPHALLTYRDDALNTKAQRSVFDVDFDALPQTIEEQPPAEMPDFGGGS